MHSDNKVSKARYWDGIVIKKVLIAIGVIIVTAVFCEWPDFHPESYFGANYSWWLDMIFHGGYYFAMTIFLYIVFCKGKQVGLFWGTVLLTSYAFEALQVLIPHRTPSLLYLTSNFLGITLATVLCTLFYR